MKHYISVDNKYDWKNLPLNKIMEDKQVLQRMWMLAFWKEKPWQTGQNKILADCIQNVSLIWSISWSHGSMIYVSTLAMKRSWKTWKGASAGFFENQTCSFSNNSSTSALCRSEQLDIREISKIDRGNIQIVIHIKLLNSCFNEGWAIWERAGYIHI